MLALRRQSGFTLPELLIAAAIAAIVVAPLGNSLRAALGSANTALETNDTGQQARFAMQRMVAAVQGTAPHALSAKAAGTSADWLSPASFCLNGAAQLIETTPADTACAGARVIADRVGAFSVLSYAAGAQAATVIEIQLTLTGPGGQSAALTSHTRLGGGTL